MPFVEACIIGGVTAAAAAAAGVAEDYVQRQREWWRPEKRPAEHPMACDCRDSLGMSHFMRYTNKDICKHERQAIRWWHPDKNHGVDRGIADFRRIVVAFKSPYTRQLYAEAVDRETALMEDLGGVMDWRTFNERFLRSVEANPLTQARGKTQAYRPELCHVFLDASASMQRMSKDGKNTRREAGKAVVSDLFPRFMDSPTTMHMIGTKNAFNFRGLFSRMMYSQTDTYLIGKTCASECLIPHDQDISLSDEQWLLQEWDARCSDRTYLWEYIHDQIKDFKDCKHDVIIITDGWDNESAGEFHGLSGFNGLMERMRGGRVRISTYLLGDSVPMEKARIYRDVCIATGGVFSAEAGELANGVVDNFVYPLLLPEGERDFLAIQQQHTYQAMLASGEAQGFGWHLPIEDSHASGSGTPFAPPRRGTARATVPEPLAPRVKVRIHGPQSALDLNGCVGVCEKWLASQGRWEVKLDSGGLKAVSAANLLVCRE